MGAYGSNMEFDSSFHMWESTGIAEQEHLDCSPGIQFLDDSFDYFLFYFTFFCKFKSGQSPTARLRIFKAAMPFSGTLGKIQNTHFYLPYISCY